MKRLKFVLASVGLAILSRGAFAAVTNTWVGANTADGAADTVVDTSVPADSPVMEGGKRAYGSTIDVRAFANGDLLGKGTRTIPALPPEVAAALPDPNNVVVPLEGH